MAGFYGGDTEQMRGHATACRQGSQRIEDITDAATQMIDAVPWLGPDAVAFRALWHGTVKPGLLAKAEDIRARGTEIDEHAEQQDRASDDGDGGFWDRVRDVIGDILPHIPIIPGVPLTPENIERIRDAIEDGFIDGGERPGQEFYGDEGYEGRGWTANDDRPIGGYHDDFSAWDGNEIEGEYGHLNGYAEGGYSLGGNHTVDEHGNHTGTVGGRAGAEIGGDGEFISPFGGGIAGSGAIGAEGYLEAGGTIGPDGFSGGGRAGAGVYAEGDLTITSPDGDQVGVSGNAYAGAYASANAYSHATRNEDGNINGWSAGFDARAFAGAQAAATFEAGSPDGWFNATASVSAKGGAGAGGGAGVVASTDAVGVSLSGDIATGLGFGGSVSFSVNPNAIFDSITPGQYNLDDAIGDATGALETAGGWVSDNWPF
jgi:hypothetical protein